MAVQSFDPHLILREELSELLAYSPHAGDYEVRLDANEAPPLLSAGARQRLAEVSQAVMLERYPDAGQKELRQAIATRLGVGPGQVLCGVGSDEIITLLMTVATRLRGRAPAPSIVTTTPTFVMYRLSARIRGERVVEVPLDDDWDLAETSMLRAIEMAAPNLIFIASPNNPTGTMVSRQRLENVLSAAKDALVIVDEAYIDYSSREQLDLIESYENVAILRTLSKIGFASLRVGWIVGQSSLIRELDKARLPYNLPTVCQRLATVVVSELGSEIAATRTAVLAERQRVQRELSSIPGLDLPPSEANFLWIGLPKPAEQVFAGLGERGVLVRSFHGRGGRLDRFIRVTIGTGPENDRFLQAFKETL
jgi:histidinol-phosphate aminotransferase